jgi:hypothetical protein
MGVPDWPKSFRPRLLAKILWDFAYLCWANPYVNDVLVPRGFEDIVKDDFSSLRQMLTVADSEETA